MTEILTTREIENFGHNIRFTPEVFYEPTEEQEILRILDRHAGEKIRVVGRLHSWSRAFQNSGVVISLRHFTDVTPAVTAKKERREEVGLIKEVGTDASPITGSSWSSCKYAWVGAGIQIKDLLRALGQHGKTLPSVGLITQQTIVGAISTGTHGSGRKCLSHFVEAVRIAYYDPESGKATIETIEDGDALRAAQCSIGNLGVILSVKLPCRDQYNVEEFWQPYATLQQVLRKESDYPLQQFFLIPWQWEYLAQHRRETEAGSAGPEWIYRIYFFLSIDILLHSLLAALAKTPRSFKLIQAVFRGVLSRSVIRNWRIVGDSSRMLVMKQELFRHFETELFVKQELLPNALEFVRQTLEWAAGNAIDLSGEFRDLIAKAELHSELEAIRGVHCHHFPICVRRILPDNTLISMTSGGSQDWYSISLITYSRVDEREGFLAVVRLISKALAQHFGARPHWGKHIPLSSQELVALYPEFAKFRELCIMRDPEGRFRNSWFEHLFHENSK